MAKAFQRTKYTASDANSWEKTFGVLMTPFERFAKYNSSSGILLIVCTIIALVIANSPLAEAYNHFLHTPISLQFADKTISLTIHGWINDALMAIFFYAVGLEIKHEMMVGELSSIQQALLPIIAAIGGMIVPALIYAAINYGKPGIQGWGIPMATDIAFAIAALMLLGNRVPVSLMTILAALAIVDDLGAVVVIAVFYTSNLSWVALGGAFACFAVMLVLNRMGVRWLWVFALIAIVMWFFMFFSGVHATIAGVLGAFATPSNSVYKPSEFSREARKLLDKFDVWRNRDKDFFSSENLTGVLHTLSMGIDKARTPLQRMDHALHTPVYFLIIPLFALTNAGVTLNPQDLAGALHHPITIGVACGLVFGKFIGVAGSVLLCDKLGIAKLPKNIHLNHVIGMGMLAGIGFTMSIFISDLAFKGNAEQLVHAKTAILFASIFAGVCGFLFLYFTSKNRQGETNS